MVSAVRGLGRLAGLPVTGGEFAGVETGEGVKRHVLGSMRDTHS
jgi:hypothetical protein